MVKDNHEEKIELAIRRNNEKRIAENNRFYAIKLVEKIVFGLVTLILIAVIGALVTLIIK